MKELFNTIFNKPLLIITLVLYIIETIISIIVGISTFIFKKPVYYFIDGYIEQPTYDNNNETAILLTICSIGFCFITILAMKVLREYTNRINASLEFKEKEMTLLWFHRFDRVNKGIFRLVNLFSIPILLCAPILLLSGGVAIVLSVFCYFMNIDLHHFFSGITQQQFNFYPVVIGAFSAILVYFLFSISLFLRIITWLYDGFKGRENI